jgi:DNA-binding XRE family transcriptional regulator
MASETTMRAFGDWVRGLRAHLEQTQAQFALAVGVHRTTVARWETAKLYPDAPTRSELNRRSQHAGYTPVPPAHDWRSRA